MRKPYLLCLMLALLLLLPLAGQGARAEQPGELTATITLDKESVAVGETITASWTVVGGTEPYEIQFHWRVVDGGEDQLVDDAQRSGSDNTPVTFSPTFGKSGALYLTVIDALMIEAYASADFTISDAPEVKPLVLSAALDKGAVILDRGESVTASWQATGGLAPYEFFVYWSTKDSDAGEYQVAEQATLTAQSHSFTPTKGVGGQLWLNVVDELGRADETRLDFLIVRRGDANGDGAVNIKDLEHVVDHLLDNSKPIKAPANANMDGQAEVDIADLKQIIDMVVGD